MPAPSRGVARRGPGASAGARPPLRRRSARARAAPAGPPSCQGVLLGATKWWRPRARRSLYISPVCVLSPCPTIFHVVAVTVVPSPQSSPSIPPILSQHGFAPPRAPGSCHPHPASRQFSPVGAGAQVRAARPARMRGRAAGAAARRPRPRGPSLSLLWADPPGPVLQHLLHGQGSRPEKTVCVNTPRRAPAVGEAEPWAHPAPRARGGGGGGGGAVSATHVSCRPTLSRLHGAQPSKAHAPGAHSCTTRSRPTKRLNPSPPLVPPRGVQPAHIVPAAMLESRRPRKGQGVKREKSKGRGGQPTWRPAPSGAATTERCGAAVAR
jgi:hypothetical protein